MNQLSKSAQDMEASTFVARLRQAASKEDSIAHALAGQINTIAGMTMEELDPSTRREMETIATLQNASTQDIGWILEDPQLLQVTHRGAHLQRPVQPDERFLPPGEAGPGARQYPERNHSPLH